MIKTAQPRIGLHAFLRKAKTAGQPKCWIWRFGVARMNRRASTLHVLVLAATWFSMFCPLGSQGQTFGFGPSAQEKERLAFLQTHFAKFVPVQFQKGTNLEASVQILKAKENDFEFQGRYYCGFRFSTPSWLDGDFAWAFLLANTEEQKNFIGSGLEWYIIQEKGSSRGFEDYSTKPLARYPILQARFKNTHEITIQHCDLGNLNPDKTYAIWFSFKERDIPNVAFVMTIRSERGEAEFGTLPLK